MNPLPLSWTIAGGLGLTIAAFLAGGYTGRALCQNGYFRAQQKIEAKHDAVISGAQAQDQAAADHDVERQTIIREIVREVPTIVDRPVYRNACADADGVRLIGRAVTAANDGSSVSGAAGAPGEVHPTIDVREPADR